MPKKLSSKISSATHQLVEELVAQQSTEPRQSKQDAPLFFTDTKGSIESKRHQLRRQRDEADQSEAGKRAEELARVETKRRKFVAKSKPALRLPQPQPQSTSAQPIVSDTPLFDLWSDDVHVAKVSLPATQLARDFRAHAASGIVDAATATSATMPHPGQSFNPDPEEHRQLLEQAIETDAQIRREQALIRQQLYPDRHGVNGGDEDDGVKEEEEDMVKEEEDGDDTVGIIRPPSRTRLTTAQRNRQTRHAALLELQQQLKAEKKKYKDIDRLPNIIASINNAKKMRLKTKALKAQLRSQVNPMERVPRLGPVRPIKFGRLIPDVKLSDEKPRPAALSQSTLMINSTSASPSGVKSAFHRLQQRRLIEPRLKQKVHRRYQLKEFDRHRDSKYEGQLAQYARKQ